MYVCICHAVNDRAIRDAVLDGADSLEAVADVTGAGTCCASCHDGIQDVIDLTLNSARCAEALLDSAGNGMSTMVANTHTAYAARQSA